MPALPPLAGHLRIRLIGSIQGQPWNAVQYARYTGTAPSDTDLQTAGTAVGTAWNSAIAQLCHSTVTLNQVEMVDLSALDAGVGVATTPHPGTRIGGPNPNNTAMCASYKIHVRYRGGHPRTYWPAGIAADITSGRQWAGAFLTLAQGACVDYVGDINAIQLGGGPLTFVAVSYYHGKDPATGLPALRPTPIPYTVTTVTVHQRVDTMRRRLGKESA